MDCKKGNKLKIKNFKRRIGITEKSHGTRRDHWGGNVNCKSLFWLYNHSRSIMKLRTIRHSTNEASWSWIVESQSQNRDLWFTWPPQRSLLVLWLFSAILLLKFSTFIRLVNYVNPFSGVFPGAKVASEIPPVDISNWLYTIAGMD